MPHYSLFWDKHYKDIGNCCMTQPLDKIVPGTNGTRLVDYIDTDWMTQKKMKWIGWDKQWYYAWITPNGMIHRFDDLERNERGKKYEKEKEKLEIYMDGGGVPEGFPKGRDLYEWELQVQEKCGFCGGASGKKGDGKEKEEGDGDGGKEMDGDGGGGTDTTDLADEALDFANTDPTEYARVVDTEDVIDTSYVTYTGNDALSDGNFYGQTVMPDDKEENPYIPPVPYKPPVELPADVPPPPPPRPQVVPPRHMDPVLDTSKVLDTTKVLATVKSPFEKIMEERLKNHGNTMYHPPLPAPDPIDKLRVETKPEPKDFPKPNKITDYQKFGASIMGNSPREELDLPRIHPKGKLFNFDYAEFMKWMGLRNLGHTKPPNFNPKRPDMEEAVKFLDKMIKYPDKIEKAREEEIKRKEAEEKKREEENERNKKEQDSKGQSKKPKASIEISQTGYRTFLRDYVHGRLDTSTSRQEFVDSLKKYGYSNSEIREILKNTFN